MIRFSITSDTQAFENFTRALDALPQEIQKAVENAAQEGQQTRDEIARYPGKVRYPIQWTSPRQKAYYFAKIAKRDAQGNIIPYERTGGLGRDWNLFAVRRDSGAVLVLENKNPAAKYVYGFFGQPLPQQQFHVNTGWKTLNSDALKIRSLLYEDVIANISGVLARAGKL